MFRQPDDYFITQNLPFFKFFFLNKTFNFYIRFTNFAMAVEVIFVRTTTCAHITENQFK